jgi:hypothetical protein
MNCKVILMSALAAGSMPGLWGMENAKDDRAREIERYKLSAHGKSAREQEQIEDDVIRMKHDPSYTPPCDNRSSNRNVAVGIIFVTTSMPEIIGKTPREQEQIEDDAMAMKYASSNAQCCNNGVID